MANEPRELSQEQILENQLKVIEIGKAYRAQLMADIHEQDEEEEQ